MDRMRLVMPPLLFTVLQAPFTRLAHTLFPNWMANGIISGSFTFYVLYDVMHYALHHTKLPEVRLLGTAEPLPSGVVILITFLWRAVCPTAEELAHDAPL